MVNLLTNLRGDINSATRAVGNWVKYPIGDVLTAEISSNDQSYRRLDLKDLVMVIDGFEEYEGHGRHTVGRLYHVTLSDLKVAARDELENENMTEFYLDSGRSYSGDERIWMAKDLIGKLLHFGHFEEGYPRMFYSSVKQRSASENLAKYIREMTPESILDICDEGRLKRIAELLGRSQDGGFSIGEDRKYREESDGLSEIASRQFINCVVVGVVFGDDEHEFRIGFNDYMRLGSPRTLLTNKFKTVQKPQMTPENEAMKKAFADGRAVRKEKGLYRFEFGPTNIKIGDGST